MDQISLRIGRGMGAYLCIISTFLGFSSLALSVYAQETKPLFGRVAAVAAPNTPWDDAWQDFKGAVDLNTENITLEYLIRGEVGNEDESLRALRRNRVQIVGASLSGMAVLVPEMTVAMAPYLFESEEEVDFVYDNYLLKPAQKLFAKKGIALLRWNEVGWTDLYANKPVRVPEDAKNIKLRGAPNIAAQVFLQGVGANSIPVGSMDLVPALQRGLVRGGTSNLVFHYFSTRPYASHVTLTHHSYDTGGQLANLEWYESATQEQQQVLLDAFGPPSKDRAAVRGLMNDLIAAMREEGITIIEPTDEERAAWIEVSRPLVRQIIEEVGGESQMFYEAILEGKKAFRALKAAERAASENGEME